MAKQHIQQLIYSAIEQLKQSGDLLVETPVFQIEATKDKQHGDFACNIAMMLAKPAQRKPRELAEMIVKSLPASNQIKKIEIAGPGFINFFLSSDALYSVITDILSLGEKYGQSNKGKGKRILVEFVSANPNGPLHVGHGRHAAYGAVVSDLLQTIGYDVHREYYVNDAGRQMDIVTASTWLRYLALCGESIVFPTNAYKGDYVINIARTLFEQKNTTFSIETGKVFENLPLDEPQGGDKDIYIDALVLRAKQLLGEEKYKIIFD